jgi:uncharacterized protein (TIGR00251 family)
VLSSLSRLRAPPLRLLTSLTTSCQIALASTSGRSGPTGAASAAAAAAPSFTTTVLLPFTSSPSGAGTLVSVVVQPGARSDDIAVEGGVLRVRTTAPPRDGEANTAIVEAVAGLVGIAKSLVSVERGHKDRHKILLVNGKSVAEVATKMIGVSGWTEEMDRAAVAATTASSSAASGAGGGAKKGGGGGAGGAAKKGGEGDKKGKR